MTKAAFEQVLLAASNASRQFASRFVTNNLPADCRYVVYLNQSFDDNPLEVDESVFSNDPPQVGTYDSPLKPHEVVGLLWRDGAMPEWIDISTCRASERFTIYSLLCCGRFTPNQDRLYYPESEFSPFGIKSPLLPSHGWTEAQGLFDLNTTKIPQ